MHTFHKTKDLLFTILKKQIFKNVMFSSIFDFLKAFSELYARHYPFATLVHGFIGYT